MEEGPEEGNTQRKAGNSQIGWRNLSAMHDFAAPVVAILRSGHTRAYIVKRNMVKMGIILSKIGGHLLSLEKERCPEAIFCVDAQPEWLGIQYGNQKRIRLTGYLF